jgi:ribosomal protein S12
MAKWLDKYEQGGLVLKKKTKDNYGKQSNYNDAKASVGPDFVGLGYNTKGRDYSPAWGGQFQNGGELTENNWLDKYQDGGESPQVNEKEKILKHSPNSKGHYELTKTITPFKTNRQIRKGVEAPLYPNEVNFISNYTGSLGDIKNQPSAVEFEGDKHWNIDRFIMDPAFGHGYPALESGQSKKGLKKFRICLVATKLR